jgi:integrative and conjugative element protein (TIGR02256 family)
MWSFRPDRSAERKEIRKLFEEGLHYLGDWHTHAQRRPHPSGIDLESMSELVLKSRHELSGFLMVIVGSSEPPEGLWVSFHGVGQPPERLRFIQRAVYPVS